MDENPAEGDPECILPPTERWCFVDLPAGAAAGDDVDGPAVGHNVVHREDQYVPLPSLVGPGPDPDDF